MKSELIRLQAGYSAPERVEGDVIYGCSICTAGEALGHGVHLDESFIQEAFEQSSALKLGLKARFGHPGMCNEALGTTVGRFKNFRLSKDGTQFYGDLHFGEYANPEYKRHILGLAKEDPEAFGTSIVFAIGGYYRKDMDGNDVDVSFSNREEYEDYEGDPEELSEELYVRCGQMYGCDFVDEPAANPGGLFSNGSPSAQMHEFFQSHPEVLELLESNKNVVDIIETYGVQIKQFLNKEHIMSQDVENTEVEEFESNSDNSHENCQDLAEEVELESAEDVIEDDVVEDQVETMSASDFRDLVEEFGAEIATAVFDSNGSRADALELKVQKLEEELDAVKQSSSKLLAKYQQVKAEKDELACDGISFGVEVPKKRDIAKNIKF